MSLNLPVIMANGDRPFRFLDLPGEIRNMIYVLLFQNAVILLQSASRCVKPMFDSPCSQTTDLAVHKASSRYTSALLGVSHGVRAESLDSLRQNLRMQVSFKNVICQIHDSALHVEHIPPRLWLSYVKYIEKLEMKYIDARTGCTFDPTILPKLKELTIATNEVVETLLITSEDDVKKELENIIRSRMYDSAHVADFKQWTWRKNDFWTGKLFELIEQDINRGFSLQYKFYGCIILDDVWDVERERAYVYTRFDFDTNVILDRKVLFDWDGLFEGYRFEWPRPSGRFWEVRYLSRAFRMREDGVELTEPDIYFEDGVDSEDEDADDDDFQAKDSDDDMEWEDVNLGWASHQATLPGQRFEIQL